MHNQLQMAAIDGLSTQVLLEALFNKARMQATLLSDTKTKVSSCAFHTYPVVIVMRPNYQLVQL